MDVNTLSANFFCAYNASVQLFLSKKSGKFRIFRVFLII